MADRQPTPFCLCGEAYPKARSFKWGSKLLRNRVEFEVFVCEGCHCYWYRPAIPRRAKQYAFETFDRLHQKNRLPSPAMIREYRRTRPDAYRNLDIEAYERGKIPDFHPLYYRFFARHIASELEEREREMEKVENILGQLESRIKQAEADLSWLRQQKRTAQAVMDSLLTKFVYEA